MKIRLWYGLVMIGMGAIMLLWVIYKRGKIKKMWVLFALGAALLTSFNPILFKRMLQDADAIILVWGVTLLSLPLLGLFTLALTPHWPALDWLFLVGVGGSALLNVVAQLASTRALKLADVSLVTPLLVFSPVFTVLISALSLKEIPSAQGLFGVVLVLVGAYWLNHNPGEDWFTPIKSLAFAPGVMLVLFAGLLWAFTPLFEKTAIQHTFPESPSLTAFVATALLTLFLTPVVLIRSRRAIHQLSMHRRDFILASIIAGIAPVLGYTAFSLGFVGYVTTLFKLSTLMTVIWSFLLLREHHIAQRLPGSVLMVIGSILIAT